MTVLSDETLIERTHTGDYSAAGELVVRYTPVVLRYAERYCYLGLEREDLMQEGMIALLAAVRSYRADGGASFRTYASRCIANGLGHVAESHLRARNIPLALLAPLEEAGEVTAPSRDQPEERVISAESGEAARRLLTDYERDCLQLLLEGYRYADIAKKLGRTEKSVDGALTRARSKLRRALGEGE